MLTLQAPEQLAKAALTCAPMSEPGKLVAISCVLLC
jgi:hypothetical protein